MKTFPDATKRIRFATWQPTDSDKAQTLWGNPQVTKFISTAGFTDEQIKQRLNNEIRSQNQYGVQYWPIYTKDSELVGCCGLHFEKDGRYELGFHLLPQYWHLGYGSEAAQGVIQFAKSNPEILILEAGHHPQNKASQHLLIKLGFKYIGDQFYAPTGLQHPTYELQL